MEATESLAAEYRGLVAGENQAASDASAKAIKEGGDASAASRQAKLDKVAENAKRKDQIRADIERLEQQMGEVEAKAGVAAPSGKQPTKPRLDGTDYQRILNGELLDLSEFSNPEGKRLRIDPDYKPPGDPKGRTNAQRAKDSVAPILPGDEGVELHHVGQDFFGPLDEHSESFHRHVGEDPDYHPYTGDPGYLTWRGEVGFYKGKIRTLGDIYDLLRAKYWRARFK